MTMSAWQSGTAHIMEVRKDGRRERDRDRETVRDRESIYTSKYL